MDRCRGHLTRSVSESTQSLNWMKVIVVGDEGCGKTSIIKYFCESKFNLIYQPTIGVDYGFKIHHVKGKDLRIHLWDLSGSSAYFEVRNELYFNSDVVLFVYDSTKSFTVDNLDGWVQELLSFSSKNTVMCLVGNKVDMRGSTSSDANVAEEWAVKHGMRFYETSCRTGANIDVMMTSLLDAALMDRIEK